MSPGIIGWFRRTRNLKGISESTFDQTTEDFLTSTRYTKWVRTLAYHRSPKLRTEGIRFCTSIPWEKFWISVRTNKVTNGKRLRILEMDYQAPAQTHVYGNAPTSATGCSGRSVFIKWTVWTRQSSPWMAEVCACWPGVDLWTGRPLAVTSYTVTFRGDTRSQLCVRSKKRGAIEDVFKYVLM